jgi:hypothetical protein
MGAGIMRVCRLVVIITALVLGVSVPVAPVESAPQPGVTVSREVTTDPATGLRVVTERTFRHGVLIKVQIRTYAPGGRLLRRVEETFTNQRIATRETVVFNAHGRIISKVAMTFDAAGRLVEIEQWRITYQGGQRREVKQSFRLHQGALTEIEREEVIYAVVDGRWVRTTRTYELRGGRLTLVSEEREVLRGTPPPAGLEDKEDDKEDDRED